MEKQYMVMIGFKTKGDRDRYFNGSSFKRIKGIASIQKMSDPQEVLIDCEECEGAGYTGILDCPACGTTGIKK